MSGPPDRRDILAYNRQVEAASATDRASSHHIGSGSVNPAEGCRPLRRGGAAVILAIVPSLGEPRLLDFMIHAR
jgi:hypothetical protein